MKIFLRALLLMLIFPLFLGCPQKKDTSEANYPDKDKGFFSDSSISKINGVSFVASKDTISQENISPLKSIHANYVAIMPFGIVKNLDHPTISYNQKWQWFGETQKGAGQYIRMLHNNNIRIMVKPQVWVWNGAFTGLMKMTSEADWLELERGYRNFIMDFAKVAEDENVEIFCIGTELENFVIQRPNYWRNLIAEIKTIYKGKLTYAANWDEYKRVPFWDAVDYIGVDAYFPVSKSQTPTVEEARRGWAAWKEELENFSQKENKQIIFTEYGYRSVDYAGKQPWESDHTLSSMNLGAQANTLQALYEEIWSEKWFAGGFLWKWFIAHDQVGGKNDNQFTPQNKPAEAIVARFYKIW